MSTNQPEVLSTEQDLWAEWIKGAERLAGAAPDLLAACKAQHEAIDRLFARLIVLTRDHTPDDPFFPTKSGQPWDACQLGNAAIKKAEGR